ncbi:MAG TPA: hypothetical protein VLM05_15920, partial [Mycobacteriales bacterium]|nr:hypothetical protein [Mycobacteriales bacterium]
MASPIFDVCDRFVVSLAELDPVWGTMRGISGAGGAATDYGPAGIEARADLARATLAALDAVDPAGAGGRSGADLPAGALAAALGAPAGTGAGGDAANAAAGDAGGGAGGA